MRRKVFDRDPRLPIFADKIAVKEFVASRIGAEFVTPTLWHGDQLPALESRNWPLPFVLKANNGSGTNIFVRDYSDIDWPKIELKCKKWLETSHAKWAGEWVYEKIRPELLIEPYIGDSNSLPVDYKLFIFSGKVHYIEVDTDRETVHKRTFFDRHWNRMEFSMGYPIDPKRIEPPNSLLQMIDLGEKLGDGLDFVRIDFYEIRNIPKFGEMTFYPDAGIGKFSPDNYDYEFGDLWK